MILLLRVLYACLCVLRKRAMRGQSRVSFTAARDAGTRRATSASHVNDLRASYAPSLVGDARSHLYVRALERRMLPLDAASRTKVLFRLAAFEFSLFTHTVIFLSLASFSNCP